MLEMVKVNRVEHERRRMVESKRAVRLVRLDDKRPAPAVAIRERASLGRDRHRTRLPAYAPSGILAERGEKPSRERRGRGLAVRAAHRNAVALRNDLRKELAPVAHVRALPGCGKLGVVGRNGRRYDNGRRLAFPGDMLRRMAREHVDADGL